MFSKCNNFCIPVLYALAIYTIIYHSSCIKKQASQYSLLISVTDAKSVMVNSANWCLFEISKPENYSMGHIKNAYNIWRPDYSDNENKVFTGMRATKSQLEELLGRYGIDKETKILLYDEKGNCDAARFAWQLELWGLKNFHLINGGKKSWQLQGFPLTKTVPALPTANNIKMPFLKEQEVLFATYNDVYKALKDTNTLLVDTRELYEFIGEPFEKDGKFYNFKKGAFTNGAIPTAKHYNWSNAVNLDSNHQLKHIKDLEYDLSAAGIQPHKNIILYCQSGTRSAHTSFVLRHILNYPNVKNYDGSWIEWSYLNTTNIKDAPVQVNYIN